MLNTESLFTQIEQSCSPEGAEPLSRTPTQAGPSVFKPIPMGSIETSVAGPVAIGQNPKSSFY